MVKLNEQNMSKCFPRLRFELHFQSCQTCLIYGCKIRFLLNVYSVFECEYFSTIRAINKDSCGYRFTPDQNLKNIFENIVCLTLL